MESLKKLRKHKCLVILPYSNVIILDNLDMYEIINQETVVKLEAKSTIDFNRYYEKLANFTNPTFPVDLLEKELIWDY